MSSYHPQDMYHESAASRSPGSLRYQQATLNRQPSRQFADGFSGPLNGLYTMDDHAAQNPAMPRFSADRLNATLNSNSYAAYDMNAAQAWNAFGTGHNNTLAALGATNRMKPRNGGRTGLPSVCFSLAILE